jgi:hypothetical protein
MNIIEALTFSFCSYKIKRKSKNFIIDLDNPDVDILMFSIKDILADDWYILEEE